ncbi:proline--tRNA ligase [Candidatus Woesearchaeota archaeon]|nr:proline--tRNA ligase [Candidatus Woesearchaeota archaeon]
MEGVQAGITVKKGEDFSEWYQQILLKADLIDYSPVSGCYVIKPNAYFIWEQIQAWFDREIKKLGVKNAYFPLFIPESLLKKESKHVEGFAPEVAWVTQGGNSQLAERLAVRPTSETIMYDSFARWIQSHKELPFRINQWCNVVRWEFKHPTPFLRAREFLWQEGHTVHATKESADEEVFTILDLYERVFSELLAIPVIKGKKSEDEKFAGALYSTSCEVFLTHGKAVQGCTSHCLGQNFSKAFGIRYLDDKGNSQFCWQNSWGISTRSLGIAVMMHGDDKGVVLPPRVAFVQVVVVPILFEQSKNEVLAFAKQVEKLLKHCRVLFDDRQDYTAGWKFNEWEMKGIPIRVEVGPKDVEKKQAVVVRRDTGEKQIIPLDKLGAQITSLLELIQKELYDRAKAFLTENTVYAGSWKQFEEAASKGALVKADWCENSSCHEKIKEKTGTKCLTLSLSEIPENNCVQCGSPAKEVAYFAKSY